MFFYAPAFEALYGACGYTRSKISYAHMIRSSEEAYLRNVDNLRRGAIPGQVLYEFESSVIERTSALMLAISTIEPPPLGIIYFAASRAV